jgi:long-chain acyl-CoA synthetase
MNDFPSLLAGLADGGARPALSFYRGRVREARLDYAELLARVQQVAAQVAAAGISVGDRVAVLTPNRIEVPVLVLALLARGAVVVPLNPGSPVEDWGYVLEHSGARALWATRELGARAAAVFSGAVFAVEEAFAGDATAAPPMDAGALADAPAVVLYTSGTTGRPKGVMLRQSSLIANARSMAQNFGLDRTTQLAVLPLYHAHAFGFGLMTALSTGGHLVFTERLEPFTWADVVAAEWVTVSSVVPTLLPLLLAARVTRARIPSLRHLMVSSAPLPTDLARQFETQTGIPLIQGWGLSEYTNFACCVSPGDPERDQLMWDREVPSVGPALGGVEVRVVDGSGAPVGAGVRGELEVRGPSRMIGYFHDDEATARAITSDGFLRTGDEGYFELHGGRPVYYIAGRLKEIIIRDGEKHSPLAIERRLAAQLPEIAGRIAVLGFAHRGHGEEVGAYLEQDELDDALRTRLEAAVAQLPLEERPKIIVHGAEPIPRTHTGKVQRRKMQPWFAGLEDLRGPLRFVRR